MFYYQNNDTFIHRLNPLTKIIFVVIQIVLLVIFNHFKYFIPLLAFITYAFMVYPFLLKASIKAVFNIVPLYFIIILSGLIFNIPLLDNLILIGKIVMIVLLSSLFLISTNQNDIIQIFWKMTKGKRLFQFLALYLTLIIRYIPIIHKQIKETIKNFNFRKRAYSISAFSDSFISIIEENISQSHNNILNDSITYNSELIMDITFGLTDFLIIGLLIIQILVCIFLL